jgi:thiamine biosynthesis lipoprotein
MIRSIEFRAMNTSVTLAAEGQGAVAGLYATKLFIDQCEQRFSRFLPASEICELNNWAGEWLQISEDLMDMLQISMKYFQETQGLFDPSILPELERAGYDRSFDEIREGGELPVIPVSTREARPAFSELQFDRENRRVRLPRGMQIDLGGIAKGWIVEKAALLLHSYAEVCAVSAGGDLLFIGQPLDGTLWDVYLEDPRNTTEMLAQFRIPAGAVATSSIMKRSWLSGDKVRHHLIDPRTGEPAQTEWLSVTVICPDVVAAEVYAKAILIAGESGLAALLRSKPEITFIAVDPQGNLLESPNCREYIYEFAPDTIVSARTAF